MTRTDKPKRDITTFEIYNLSIELALDFYNLIKNLPFDERYNLKDQLRRAVTSVGANIAEGYGRYHYKGSMNFFFVSRGSLYECRFYLDLMKNLSYISLEEHTLYIQKIINLTVKINNYIIYLRLKLSEST